MVLMKTEFEPLVSIGIPTFNRAGDYLPLALGSALAQDYANLEIIVSDNASTDATMDFVRSKNDPRIRYFRHEESIGPANNPNFCVEQATGVYFLLLHDDDMIDPDFVSACVRALDGNPSVGVVRTGIRVIDAEGGVVSCSENEAGGLSFEGFLRAWFNGKTRHYLPNTLFNTAELKKLGGFHSKTYMFEDAVALVRLASELGRVDVREIKASFRRHEENFGRHPSRVRAWVEDCLYLRDVIMESVAEYESKDVYRDATRFLCRKSYRHASGLPSLMVRWGMYWEIYAMFGYRHLPPTFHVRKRIRRLRNKFRETGARGRALS
jgi:glycosyltransferase involved in cell wall biosynthesis